MNAIKDYTITYFGSLAFCLIFMLSKIKIQSTALLKMPLSPPSPEGFGLDIKKYISIH